MHRQGGDPAAFSGDALPLHPWREGTDPRAVPSRQCAESRGWIPLWHFPSGRAETRKPRRGRTARRVPSLGCERERDNSHPHRGRSKLPTLPLLDRAAPRKHQVQPWHERTMPHQQRPAESHAAMPFESHGAPVRYCPGIPPLHARIRVPGDVPTFGRRSSRSPHRRLPPGCVVRPGPALPRHPRIHPACVPDVA